MIGKIDGDGNNSTLPVANFSTTHPNELIVSITYVYVVGTNTLSVKVPSIIYCVPTAAVLSFIPNGLYGLHVIETLAVPAKTAPPETS